MFRLDGKVALITGAAGGLGPADKAVDSGALGCCANVGRQHDVKESKAGLSLLDLFAAELVGLGHVKHVGICIAGITTHRHNVGHKLRHGVYGTQLPSVTAVPKTTATLFLLDLFTHGDTPSKISSTLSAHF